MKIPRHSTLIRWLCFAQALVVLVIGLPWSPVTLRSYSSYAYAFPEPAPFSNTVACEWETHCDQDQGRARIILDELPGRKSALLPHADLQVASAPFILSLLVRLSVVIPTPCRIPKATPREAAPLQPRAPPVFS